jgi:hypothetical protein
LLATTRFIALAYLLPAIFLTIILWGAVEFRRTRSWRSLSLPPFSAGLRCCKTTTWLAT